MHADIMFSIVIPTFNSCGDLGKLLASLACFPNELKQVEVIVVDDGSYDATQTVSKEFSGRFQAFQYHYQRNRGPAAARNLGAQKAQGEYLIFVDDDCLFPKGCLQNIKDNVQGAEGCSAWGVQTTNISLSLFSEFNQRLGCYLMQASRVSEKFYTYMSSRCYLFSKEAFWAVGGHDEDFIWAAAEDRDLCLRLEQNNIRLAYLKTLPLLETDRLSFNVFMRQNFVYGLGAGLLTQKHPEIGTGGLRRYVRMIVAICGGAPLPKRLVLFLMFCLSQASAACGFLFYRMNYDYRKRPASSFLPRHALVVEGLKNILLGIPFVKHLKKSVGSLTTGEELYTCGYLAAAARAHADIYKTSIAKTTLNENWLEGRRVLEIGPGSHLGVPLLLCAWGAEKVVAIDKYGEVKFGGKERNIYAEIIASLPNREKEKIAPIWPDLQSKTVCKPHGEGIDYWPDLSMDHPCTADRLPRESFDLIVSFNTLEHIRDLNSAFRNMSMLLKKGGLCIHRVDAGSHYALLRHTKNRLSQFMFTDALFSMLFSQRDAPTRRTVSEYIRVAKEQGFGIRELSIDERASTHEVDKSSDFLAAPYHQLPKEEISAVGFVLVAQKSI